MVPQLQIIITVSISQGMLWMIGNTNNIQLLRGVPHRHTSQTMRTYSSRITLRETNKTTIMRLQHRIALIEVGKHFNHLTMLIITIQQHPTHIKINSNKLKMYSSTLSSGMIVKKKINNS